MTSVPRHRRGLAGKRRAVLVIAMIAVAALPALPAGPTPAAAAAESTSQSSDRTVATSDARTTPGRCTGSKNRVGMTNRTIRVAHASDLTGPVPGLYRSAHLATKAYVAYFNATQRICGRRLALETYDTRTDSSTGVAAYQRICSRSFAAIGSMSAIDQGGASAAQACRLPDLRAASVSQQRNACTTCFAVRASRAGHAPNSVPDYFVAQHPAAVSKAAFLYLNAGSAPEQARTQISVAQQRGYTFLTVRAIDVAEFDYRPYVAQLKSQGVRAVHFLGFPPMALRLARAMESAGYVPDVFVAEDSAYAPSYTSGGSAVNGTISAISSLPLDARQGELDRYRTWLKKTTPGAVPTIDGLYAWSAAKLFTQQAIRLGSRLSRASLAARLRTVTGWTGGGLHAPMAVGAKQVSPCTRLLRLQGSVWKPLGGTSYRCTGIGRAR